MKLHDELNNMLHEFFDLYKNWENKLVVLGISTSEIAGNPIGKNSHAEIGVEVIEALLPAMKERGVHLAVQCCEHLNRALVVERETAEKHGLEIVSVVPQPKAGGSGATAAYALMEDAVVVESIRADAAIDVGVTMIGMHLRPVVIPVRTACVLGKARVDFAITRPKLIGGARACYCAE